MNSRKTETVGTFTDHFSELRKRVIRCVIAICAALAITIPLQKVWFAILYYPARKYIPTLQYIEIHEGFMMYLNLSLLAAFLLALPVVIWQIWKFVEPALNERERQWVTRLSGVSLGLFWAGVMFAYWIIIPIAIRFFTGFGSPTIEANIRLSNYLSFACFMLLITGLAFQVPIVLVFLMWTGIVPRRVFTRNRRSVIVIILIFSAIFTPPDPVTMILLAAPFYMLFESSLLFVKLFVKKK